MKIEEEIKQKKFESLEQKVMVNLIYTYNWLNQNTHEVFKNYDITSQQFNVLRILRGKYPDMICVGDIKQVMLDKSPDLTRLCDRLITKGFIEREHNEHNRRQVLVRITKEGLELLKLIDPVFKKRATKWVNLSNHEAEKLSELLDKLRG